MPPNEYSIYDEYDNEMSAPLDVPVSQPGYGDSAGAESDIGYYLGEPEPAAVEPVNPPVVSKSESKSSRSYNLSNQKTADINRAFTDPLRQNIAAGEADINAEYQQTADDARVISDQRQGNNKARTDLDVARAEVQEEINNDEVEMLRELKFQEKASQYIAQQKEEAAMAQWAQAVQAYEATNINPGKLWGDMNGGQKLGTAVSVFAAGVLTARGVNNQVMSNLNRAIDDNISAQLQNLEKKGKVVGQFKQMWDAVRADSESDAEARSKMRSLMMSEFRSASVAKLSAMDSDFAKLRGQEVYTAIEADMAKNMAEIRQQKRVAIEKDRAFELDVATKAAQLRLEQAASGRAERALKLQEKAATATEVPTLDEGEYVVDTTPGGQDRVLKFLPGLSPKEKETARDKLAIEGKLIDDLVEYQKLMAKLGSAYDGPLKNISVGRDKDLYNLKQQADRQREKLLLTYVKGVAATTFTDAFVKRVEPWLGANTLTTGTAKSVNQAIGALIKDATNEGNKWRKNVLQYERNPEIVKYVAGNRPGRGEDNDFATDADAIGEELYDSVGAVDSRVQKLAAAAQTYESGSKTLDIQEVKKDEVLFNDAIKYYGEGVKTSSRGNPKVTRSFKEMKDIATVALGGAESPEEEKEAFATLRILAEKKYLGGFEISDRVADEAKYWVDQVNEIRATRDQNMQADQELSNQGKEAFDRGFRPPNQSYVEEYLSEEYQ